MTRIRTGLCAAVFVLSLVALMGADQEEPAAAPAPDDPKPLDYEMWETARPGEFTGYNLRANLLQRGRTVYDKYCVGCHGEMGDGKGPAAVRLQTQPRDFTRGIYKFRSTDSGSLPLESDLYRTITHGLSRVSMPAFPLMPESDKLAVIEYIKGFYANWEAEKGRRNLVPVPLPPGDLDERERVLRGRVVYLEMQCSQCHGIDGNGTGATRTEYVDAWGNEQKPFNFTRGSLKGGNAPEDIYRTFHTGLRSIMPAYGGDTLALATRETYEGRKQTLDPEEISALEAVVGQFPQNGAAVYEMGEGERQNLVRRNSWDLVAYILSLRTRATTAQAVLGAAR